MDDDQAHTRTRGPMTVPWVSVRPPLPPSLYLRRQSNEQPFPLGEAQLPSVCARPARALAGVQTLGLGEGDEVLVPAYHHGSEIEALIRAGVTCRFYDATHSLEPDPAELEVLVSPSTRALYLIHYFGVPQDVDRWREWCDARGLLLFEDAAQAWLGHRDGKPVGSVGDLSIFCLYKTFGLPDGSGSPRSNPPPSLRPMDRKISALGTRHAAWVVGRSGILAARLPELSGRQRNRLAKTSLHSVIRRRRRVRSMHFSDGST